MAQWTTQNANTTEDLYDIDFFDRSHGVAVGNRQTVLITTDGGDTWTAANTAGLKADFRSVIMLSPDTILAGAGTIFAGQVYRTTDGGQSWESLIQAPELEVSSQGLLAFNYNHSFYSADRGTNWDTTALDIGGTVLMEDFEFANADTGFLSGLVSGFTTYSMYGFRTTDGGTNWASLWPFDLPNNNARTSLATPHPDTAYLFNNRFVNFLPGTENQLVRMTGFYFEDAQDIGSWRFKSEIVTSDMPALIISSLFLDGSRGFAGSADGDLYMTETGGQDWTIAYDGDTSIFEIVQVKEDLFFAVGGNGLILSNRLNTRTKDLPATKPVVVFPNPVKDQLYIRELSEAEAHATIYNLQGQLIRQFNWTSGTAIPIRDLAVGTYFLILQTDSNRYRAQFSKQ